MPAPAIDSTVVGHPGQLAPDPAGSAHAHQPCKHPPTTPAERSFPVTAGANRSCPPQPSPRGHLSRQLLCAASRRARRSLLNNPSQVRVAPAPANTVTCGMAATADLQCRRLRQAARKRGYGNQSAPSRTSACDISGEAKSRRFAAVSFRHESHDRQREPALVSACHSVAAA